MNGSLKSILWRTLITAACIIVIAACFYSEENWRGMRAWTDCQRELETRGEKLDWTNYIPPPVPDDQNFFTASPKITANFIKVRNDAESESFAKQPRFQFVLTDTNSFPEFDTTGGKPLVVAQLTVLPAGAGLKSTNTNRIFKLNDPDASDQIGKLIQKTAGQSANGSMGFEFSEIQLGNLVPAQIVVEADNPPSIQDLENFIPPDTATNIGHLQIEATVDKGTFQVLFTGVHITAAADYLKWSDQFVPEFDEIREALKRPDAIIPGDYSQSYLVPIPNFVLIRELAETLAQRTQCYLLLGQPDKALRELTLMHDICRILVRPPAGKPITLFEAMINVAVGGLYVATVADGMRLHAWREPQLAAIQKQLEEINFLPIVASSLRSERAMVCHTLATVPLEKIVNTYNHPTASDLGSWFVPSGWVYQNMAVVATLEQNSIECLDSTNDQIFPYKVESAEFNIQQTLRHITPWNFLAAIAIPNFARATETMARNQTLANEAQIACALERYRLANGKYPDTLAALTPQFIEKLPHDIIGGKPLIYSCKDGQTFLLYSIGWNEVDDGGLESENPLTEGDWVWQHPAK